MALRNDSRSNRLILAALAVALVPCGTAGGSGLRNATLGIGAYVSPSAVFEVEFKAAPLVISRADIQRGYVEVSVQSRLGMRTSKQFMPYNPGYLVDVSPRNDLFKSVLVTGPGAQQEFQGYAGNLSDAVAGDDSDRSSQYTYRFELAENVKPGPYSWPMAITVEL